MNKWLISIVIAVILGVGFLVAGNPLTPLLQLDSAVQPLYFDGEHSLAFWDDDTGDWEEPLPVGEYDHQFLCTAFAVETPDGVAWVTAKHCIEDSEEEVTFLGLPMWKDIITRYRFYIGDTPATVVATDEWRAYLRAPTPAVTIPWPGEKVIPEIGEEVYAISYAVGRYEGTEELYKFYHEGRVTAIAPSGDNIICELDAVGGNSGSPALVMRDGQFVLIGTLEATFSSGKTRIELFPGTLSLLPTTGGSGATQEEDDTQASLPPKALWQNWNQFPAWLQEAWTKAWQQNATSDVTGLECFGGECYWGFRLDTGLIVYVDSTTFLAFPSRLHRLDWSDHILYGADLGDQSWRKEV
jgi:hypothetical protein